MHERKDVNPPGLWLKKKHAFANYRPVFPQETKVTWVWSVRPSVSAAKVCNHHVQTTHEFSRDPWAHLPVTRHSPDRQITTFHPACAPHLYSYMLLAAFRLVIELFKGNKAASEAENTMSQLSVGRASSLQGCRGWTLCVCLHLRVVWCSTRLRSCLISTL